MADLAAIIAEGEALAAKGHASFFSHDAGAARALDLLPHLLAVAKTAVEMREASEVAASDLSDAAVDRFIAARAAFDAAVRGDAATGEGR